MSVVTEITAERIIASADSWRRGLQATWYLENMITGYANGGPPPSDEEAAGNDAIVITPLGFAQTRMKQEVGPRLDVISMEPGIIDGVYRTPVVPGDAERTSRVQSVVPTQINHVVQKYLKAILTEVAGRSTVTGRGFVYWTSPNDWQPKSGRMIYPPDAGTNPLHSRFREWVFAEKLSLRDIDTILKSNPNPGRMGWRRDGLENLKLWIMASQAQKYNLGGRGSRDTPEWTYEYNPESWLGLDLENCCWGTEPVDVYWYFKKNGEITKNDPDYGGHEKVDLYCVSRFGNQARTSFQVVDMNNRVGNFDISYNESAQKWLKEQQREYERRKGMDADKARCEHENERLLFYKKSMFASVMDCLHVDISDVAVAGEQKLASVKGAGPVMMPKIAALEALMGAMMDGLAFGVTPNWTVQTGTDKEYMDQLARFRSRPGQAFPDGIQLMSKNNAFQGVAQAGAFIGQLDASIASDSLAGATATYGRSSPEFKDEAIEQLSQKQGTLLRSLQSWYETLDAVVKRVTRTLCRELSKQKEAYPCYQDSMQLAARLINYEEVFPDEWDVERWDMKARRLAGNMTPQQTIAKVQAAMRDVAPGMPSILPFLHKEYLRAVFGDTQAAQLTKPTPEMEKSQVQSAQERVVISYTLMQPAQPGPMDNPQIHSGVASQAAQTRIQIAMQSGRATQQEVQGILAILGYAASQIQRMPRSPMSEAGLQQLQQMAKAAQSIPTMSADEQPMSQKDIATLQLKQEGQNRLKETDQDKRNKVQFDQFMAMKKLGMQQDMDSESRLTQATGRAKTQVEIQRSLMDADAQLNDESEALALPAF